MPCSGETCYVTKYTFNWAKVTVTAATGTIDGKPPTTKDVLDKVKELDKNQTDNGNPNGFTGEAVGKKAAEEEGKTLPKTIIKGKKGAYTFVDASCGPEGKCICVEVEGATGTKLKSIVKTFTIKDLTTGANQIDPRCTSFTIKISVEVTPEVFDGRCYAEEGGDF